MKQVEIVQSSKKPILGQQTYLIPIELHMALQEPRISTIMTHFETFQTQSQVGMRVP